MSKLSLTEQLAEKEKDNKFYIDLFETLKQVLFKSSAHSSTKVVEEVREMKVAIDWYKEAGKVESHLLKEENKKLWHLVRSFSKDETLMKEFEINKCNNCGKINHPLDTWCKDCNKETRIF